MKIGDKVFVVQYDHQGQVNEARYQEITKVGRKYFYVAGLDSGIEIGISLPFSYSYTVKIFRDEKSWKDGLLSEQLSHKIWTVLDKGLQSLPLEKLREVARILEIEVEE